MRLVLARHCQTDWNLERRLQGHIDTTLNETGRAQARVLGGALRDLGIQKIISSTQKRARETAEIIAPFVGAAPIVFDERLREMCFGTLEGRTRTDLEQFFGKPREEWGNDFRSFGGENMEDLRARIGGVLEDLRRDRANETFLLVSHGRSLFCLVDLLGRPGLFQNGEHQVIDIDR